MSTHNSASKSSAILPTPKELSISEGCFLRSRGSSPIFSLVIVEGSEEIRKTTDIISAELTDMCGAVVAERPDVFADFSVSLTVNQKLDHPSPEAYRLVVGDTIEIAANETPGLLYAIATLRQLITVNSLGQVEIPNCTIYDYPDIEYRFAARWLVELEGTRMMYDWGDGREKMLERYRRKIDFCMRHKINAAFFEGFEWKTDKYSRYIADIRSLNHYAAERNVKLEFGGHTIAFGGFPGHPLEGSRGLGDYNRHSYPDGDIYFCGKIPGAEYDPTQRSVTSDVMRNGTCRSNEELNLLKRAQLEEYVRKIEPGMLYIHNEDIATYPEFEAMWLNRCPSCRERWPDDRIASSNGAAGAIAHGVRCLSEGIASVKNAATGYDGRRDCLITVVSPTYGTIYDDDVTWDKIGDFWTAVSGELSDMPQIMLGVREQFSRADGSDLRIKKLADRMKQEGGGHGLFIFVVSGADLHVNNALFTATPRLNHFFKGARAIFNFNGGLFEAPQEIYNSEYAWNLRSPYGIDEAANFEEAKTIYQSRYLDLKYPDQDPLLERACELCYGEAAPEMAAFYRCRDEENNYPAAMQYLLFQQLFSKNLAQHDRAQQQHRWIGVRDQTLKASALIDAALKRPSPRPEIREELVHLRDCLIFGRQITSLVVDIFSETPNWPELRKNIQELQEFIASHGPHDFTSPYEGEINLRAGYLDKLIKFIAPLETPQVG